jgi:hypothetical protein
MHLYWQYLVILGDFGKNHRMNVPLKHPLDDINTDGLILNINKEGNNLYVEQTVGDEFAFNFQLDAVNNNCGLLLMSGLEYSEYDEGWDSFEDAVPDVEKIFPLVFKMAQRMMYSQIIYSVCDEQEDIIEALEKAGFVKLKQSVVKNRRSGNKIWMYVYNLPEEN